MILQAVAHDIKNKLAELAMRLMESDIEAAALALDAADQLSHALLLDSPDQLITHIDAASPVDLLEELAAVYGQLFPDKTAVVKVEQAPTLWYYDIALVRLALSNAVHNAFRHAHHRVTLEARAEHNALRFSVINDGSEFSDSVVAKDWASEIDKQDFKGKEVSGHSTGLGLALVHKIAQAHWLEKNGVELRGYMRLSNDDGARVDVVLP
jgi:signal transduction histidine kinase